MIERSDAAAQATAPRKVDKAQYGLAVVLAVVGAYTLIDARGLNVGFADPVGPRVFPYVIGAGMLVLAVLLAIATARGDVPEKEAGEDVDLASPADWTTVGKLVAILVLNLLLVNVLGWAITGALLFAGCAWALGSRTLLRDVLVGAVLSVGSWYFFYTGLGVPLPPGILDGVL
ncbi:tripartite tricarboxylate transporter TctB family protein [Nocardioides sp. cx-173]|uniref:tripartite tricarboxylate transporter TctB family protein n=1 Tax=Nocardioides sp. cx-173 TaxID=2898796 RepID=UPI001E623876|nr:tripartite tricarboxylate transporter TctB family protein [Nocardioides sp. cx-173]MCD4525283.1 tripartite tricarboxylate transporter TctB family protein [Nocardioides sp. cx-173]UGB40915.1 tripartite tricarboxylate transporter TctB family protein [Nocardioides sp. cx-173]